MADRPPRDRNRRTLAILLAVLAAVIITAFTVRLRAVRHDRRPEVVNLVLVSIDTLRADRLGRYGHDRDTSPRIDRLAETSTLFTDVLAPTPWTFPSHAAMLTGRHPHELGLRGPNATIPDGIPTIAEVLREAGYRTRAFVDSTPTSYLGSERGFARGFDDYEHLNALDHTGYKYDMAYTADRAIEWLGARDDDHPFFLFLHTKSVHGVGKALARRVGGEQAYPYAKPEPYLSRYATPEQLAYGWDDPDLGSGVRYLASWNQRIAHGEAEAFDPGRLDALLALYDAGIRYVDDHLARVLDALEAEGLTGNTVIAITADHGEAFLEHRFFLHIELTRNVLHVPLIVHRPWLPKGVEDRRPAALEDVVPTLLDAVGASPIPGATGQSLLPPVDPAAGPRDRFATTALDPTHFYEAHALRRGKRTAIRQRIGRRAPRTEVDFFEGSAEAERLDLPALAAPLLERIDVILEGPVATAPEIQIDDETAELLDALGYGESGR